ncbi:MAG: ATP-binding protein [Planctomycetes bacterium]|nr:ATP-binding protein [Planctomycetota bacterium]
MAEFFATVGWVLLGVVLGAAVAVTARRGSSRRRIPHSHTLAADLIRFHFQPTPLDNLRIAERRFPYRVRADLQRAIDRLFSEQTTVHHFCGVRREYSHEGVTLTDCLLVSEHYPALAVPPQYEEVDVGDEVPVRCLKYGLWLLEDSGSRFVVLLAPATRYGEATGVLFQVATVNDAEGARLAQRFFKHLEDSVLQAKSYRGKILSLEQTEHSYSGETCGIKVHRLRTVEREQVILPRTTLDLLDRNVIQFVRRRPQLAQFGQAAKKGLLFYGPPGTGKTHTIHYLARALEGHTTLLITAEQVGLLGEYMTLARLLQPSLVVIEDVDLIARDRGELGVCEEVMLNKLLNEMDGLKEEADILFVLTTNRPEALERALASRPGRVDQAIEFPLPDEQGREMLVRLYSQGVDVSDEVVQTIVRRTERVSAAFVKELMRRSVQFHLEGNGTGRLQLADVEEALEEMLFRGGSLNLKLLGAEGAASSMKCALESPS